MMRPAGRGASCLWFDAALLPGEAQVTARFGTALDDPLLRVDGRCSELTCADGTGSGPRP